MMQLNLLGEIEVLRGGEALALPPSRKTRALLAYLAATARPQRRERLCSMFWEIPDDPRGALRWSLSRLRSIVDEPACPRIVANRETVAFEPNGAEVDLISLRSLVSAGLDSLSTEQLETAAARFRGEFLEGLDLPGQHDFQSWCVAEREELRRLQIRMLSTLVDRHSADPGSALPAARRLVQIDPFNEPARVNLLRLMVADGRELEAASHFETAERLFREIGPDAVQRLARAWHDLRRKAGDRPPSAPSAPPRSVPPRDSAVPVGGVPRLVDRNTELATLLGVFERAKATSSAQVAIVLGEPGIGKSRLISELATQLLARSERVVTGHCYDAKLGSAYWPWIEALGELPISDSPQSLQAGREQLFSATAALLLDRDNGPGAVMLEDLQWADEASADMLHHVVRAARQAPLTFVLTAREGELADNQPVSSVLRSLRRNNMVAEIRLGPLEGTAIRELIRLATGAANDVDHVASLSGGNPLYAEELARNIAAQHGDIPRSLKELVRDRVERLPPETADILCWTSVIGPAIDMDRLRMAADIDPARLVAAIEALERHHFLEAVEQGDDSGSYRFRHELVRQAIYTGLSEPRRRLMHLKIARLMQEASLTGAAALDIARHAAAGGDGGMAAKSCVAAGRHCLRLFAHAEALALVRQGQHYAEGLPEPARIECMIELTEIEVGVSQPAEAAALIARLEKFAETALDHDRPEYARRCYTMLANLRWEGGAWTDARRDTLAGELVSRSADERERLRAMGEASRCLAMLERDLGTAEQLALEAGAMARRLKIQFNAVADAAGLLRCHRGQYDEAATLFNEARLLARREGDRVSEFLALEHRLTLEIELGRLGKAASLCDEAVQLASKLRPGSELPFAQALHALCRHINGFDTALDNFDVALASLRDVDSKHRLAFVATTAARLLLERGDREHAKVLAEEALAAATLLDRHSDMVVALATLAEIATACDDTDARTAHLDRLSEVMMAGVSETALRSAERAIQGPPSLPSPQGSASRAEASRWRL